MIWDNFVMNKKVLISRKDIFDTTSGAQNKALQEVQTFHSLGYEPYAIAERISKDLVEQFNGKSVKTFRWPISGYQRRKFYAKNVERWVRKNKPDLVIGHGDIFEQDVCFIHNCVHLAHQKIHNKPLKPDHQVAMIHDKILTDQKFKILVCNSMLMKNELCQRYSIPDDKAYVIHPEYNQKKFNITHKDLWRAQMRQQLGFSESDTIIGLITSGNFKKRNVELLIKAAKNFPDKKFIIVGKNKDDRYQKLCHEYGVSDRVSFLPSILEVEKYYAMIDIFVLPALIEEFGRSVLEAMAMELPVIVSSTVGASELIIASSPEMILQELTQDELVNKINKCIQNIDVYAKLNREIAIKYTHHEQNKKFIELLKSKNLI